MVVNGTMKVEVDVSPSSAISIIKNYLGLTDRGQYTSIKILDENNPMNKCKKKAIYEITDNSWYGAYNDDYRVLTTDEAIIAIVEAFLLLEKSVSRECGKLF